MTDAADEEVLACDMIDVHGAEAATLARENARGAALAGQPAQAKSWIRVLGIIQRRQANGPGRAAGSGNPLPALPAAESAEG